MRAYAAALEGAMSSLATSPSRIVPGSISELIENYYACISDAGGGDADVAARHPREFPPPARRQARRASAARAHHRHRQRQGEDAARGK